MAVDKQKWIEALGRYEKNFGNFVPYKLDKEKGEYVLAKENCACALGVYLIEVMGVPAAEIARNRPYDWGKYFTMLEIEFGNEHTVREIWFINDETNYRDGKHLDETFDRVIEYIRFSL
jgi:hypothetical protein